jgi:hypothetical protein
MVALTGPLFLSGVMEVVAWREKEKHQNQAPTTLHTIFLSSSGPKNYGLLTCGTGGMGLGWGITVHVCVCLSLSHVY